jgi:hypothetical protein
LHTPDDPGTHRPASGGLMRQSSSSAFTSPRLERNLSGVYSRSFHSLQERHDVGGEPLRVLQVG